MTVKPFSRLNYNARNYNVVSAVMVPVYGVTASSSSINEGTAVTYTITTQYVLDGTVLYWTTSGTTVAADFSDGLTSGSVTMTDGTATVVRTLTSDVLTEGAETIVFELRTVSTSGTIVASTPSGTVNDVSVLTITPSTSSVNEGSSVTWTISAVGFGTGTLYYTNSGTTTGSDFSDGLNSGSIAITADAGTLTKTLLNDLSTEGSETIIIQIRTGSTSGTVVGTSNTVTVADTSYSSQAYSVKFNGSSQYLTVPTSSFLTATNTYTIEMWINPTAYPGGTNNAVLYCILNNNVNYFGGLFLTLYGSGNMNADVRPNTGSGFANINIRTSTIVPLNTWTHVALVVNAGAATIYLNGVSSATGTVVTLAGNQTSASIGYISNGYTSGQSYYSGYISNLRILKNIAQYTAAFSPPTDNLPVITGTSLLLNGATIADSSGNSLSITNNGTTIVTMENPFGNYSTYFPSGAGSNYVVPHSSTLDFGTGDFTIEFWIYAVNMPNAAGIIGKKADDTTNGWQIYYNSTYATNRMSIRLTQQIDVTSTSSWTLNVWDHWAVTRSDTTVSWFKNGVLDATGTNSSNISEVRSVYIGYSETWAGYFTGYLSNIRVVKGSALYPWIPATTALTTTSQNATASQVSLLTAQSATIVDNGNGGPGQPTYMTGTPYITLLNGTSQYVTTPTNAAFIFNGDFTVEGWFYLTSVPGSSACLFQIGSEATNRYVVYTTSGVIYGNFYTGVQHTYGGSLSANTWYHIAFSRVGSTITCYVNGTSVGTRGQSGTLGNGPLSIGATPTGTQLLPTYITNVRAVNGTGVYTGAFTPSGPLTAITNTSLLTLQNVTFIDNSTNAFTITATGSPTLTNLINNLPITNTGTVTAGNSVIPFASTYSYQFNGSSQYLTIPANAAFAFGTGDFTIECWIYMNAAPTQWNALFAGVQYGVVSDYGLYIGKAFGSTNGPCFQFNAAGTSTIGGNFASALSLNTWHHIAITRSGTTGRLFINGAVSATVTDSTTMTNTIQKGIGGGYNGAVQTLFNGYISNFRIVKGTALYSSNFLPSTSALTATYTPSYAAQISLQTAQSSTIRDNSFNSFAITNTGTVTAGNSVVPSAGTYSYSFNGSSQYLTVPFNTAFAFGTGNFTIEAWIYPVSFNSYNGVIDLRDSNPGVSVVYFSNGVLSFGTSGSVYLETASGVILSGCWTHIACVRYNGVKYIYVNGAQVATTSDSQNNTSTSGVVYIGRTNDSWYVNGYISNLRVVKDIAVYTTAFNPPTVPLPIPSGASLLTCQYSEIMDASTNHATITAVVPRPNNQNPFGNYYASFNGSSQYLSTPYNSGWSIPAGGAFCMEAWVYMTSQGGMYSIMCINWNAGSSVSSWGFAIDDVNNFPQLLIPGSGQGSTFFMLSRSSSYTFPLNTWTHLAITRDSTGAVRSFINGLMNNYYFTALTTGSGQAMTAASGNLYVAATTNQGAGSYFPGYLSNVRFVNGSVPSAYATSATTLGTQAFAVPTTPLTAVTNTKLLTCQYADIVDSSTNVFPITNTGTVKSYLTDTFSGVVSGVNYAQKNYSLKLNTTSTNQYVDTYHASNFAFGTGDFTIESWIYLDNSFKSLSLESVGVVAWFGDNGGNPSGLFAQMGSDRLSISRPGYATNVYLRYPGATTGTPYLQYNTWYHLAITRQSATWKIFLNGVQGTTDSASDYSINTTSVRFGGSPTTSFAFPGYISNLRVVKGVAVYTGTFTPSTTPLKAAQSSGTNIAAITTQTSLLTCQYNTLFDASNNKLALTRTGAPDTVNMYPFPT